MSSVPPPPPPPPSGQGVVAPFATTSSSSQSKLGPIGVTIGAVVAVFAALLPWAELSVGIVTRTISGTDQGGDGTIVLVVAALALACGVIMLSRRVHTGWGALATLMGVVIAAIAAVDMKDVADRGDEIVTADIGIGLYLCLLAGVALMVFGLISLITANRA